MKLVFRADDRRLLGVHVIGESAAELVHVGMMVLQFDGTIDAYKYAAYDGLGALARRASAR